MVVVILALGFPMIAHAQDTDTPEPTQTPWIITATPSNTPTPTATATNTPTPTVTRTPTITPTPADLSQVELSSGSVVQVKRSITYGNIARVMALMILILVLSINHVMETVEKWTS